MNAAGRQAEWLETAVMMVCVETGLDAEAISQKAVHNAALKLRYIIDREGDANGIRRTPAYMARLIVEELTIENLVRQA